jgi:hypothetical protein
MTDRREKLVVRVTQEDIDAIGGRPNWDGNPISRAIHRDHGGDNWAFAGYVCGWDARHWDHSRRSRRFLRRFEAGEAVAPAMFILRLRS